MSGRVRDIVALFPHGEPMDASQLRFKEHVNRHDRKVFSVTSTAEHPQGVHLPRPVVGGTTAGVGAGSKGGRPQQPARRSTQHGGRLY